MGSSCCKFDANGNAEDRGVVVETEAMGLANGVDGPTRGVNAGVQIGWLKTFARERCQNMRTFIVCEEIIKVETQERQCRYVALLEHTAPYAVSTAKTFVSHTWQALFPDLCTAIAFVLPDEAFVWIDIFAVLQHPTPEQNSDLDFRSVIASCDNVLVYGMHLPEVAALRCDPFSLDYTVPVVPDTAKRCCAFFRVWCIVELVAALEYGKPLVLLVGFADETNKFIPKTDMLFNLYYITDISEASASVEADRRRILDEVIAGPGIEVVNQLARGAAMGALHYMKQPEVLKAALGYAALDALRGREALGNALRGAAAGGFLEPLKSLLQRKDEVDVDEPTAVGNTALIYSAPVHTPAVELLLAGRADVNKARPGDGMSPLIMACNRGHTPSVKILLEHKANPNQKMTKGSCMSPLMYASRGGHMSVIALLIEHRAVVNAVHSEGTTALSLARRYNQRTDVAQVLIAAGAVEK